MSAIARIAQWPFVSLLSGIVCQCLSASVLAVPDRLWYCILEPDHIMLPGDVNHACLSTFWNLDRPNEPISNMIPKLHSQNRVSLIIPTQSVSSNTPLHTHTHMATTSEY